MVRFVQFVFALLLVLCLSATSQAGGFGFFRAPIVVQRQAIVVQRQPVFVQRQQFFAPQRFVVPQQQFFVAPQAFGVQQFNGGCGAFFVR